MTRGEAAPAAGYTSLEISLRPLGAGQYSVDLRLRPGNSLAEVALIEGELPRVTISTQRLLALAADDEAYGTALAAALMVAPQVRAAVAEARLVAEQSDEPLRVVLRLGDDPDLHRLVWERLRDLQSDSFLATSQQILFSRYIDSRSTRPIRPLRRGRPKALVVAAAPSDLCDYGLEPLDVAEEVRLVRGALRPAHATVLAGAKNRPTLRALAGALRDEYDLVYLICHGKDFGGQTSLWLEKEDGTSDIVSGEQLAELISSLSRRPGLVVLAACTSAGDVHLGPAGPDERPAWRPLLAAIGPRLAAAGVGAVLAMQGRVSIQTLKLFIPALFEQLRQDNQIDRAVAAARREVIDRPDWWAPVLFLRVRDGRLPVRRWAYAKSLAQAYAPPVAGAAAMVALLLTLFAQLRDRLLLNIWLLPLLLVAGAAAAAGWIRLPMGRWRGPWTWALAVGGGVALLAALAWQTNAVLRPERLDGARFGIAVARFGEGEAFVGTAESRDVTDQVLRSIETALKASSINADVLLTGIVTSSEEARARGERLGARLVIWGQVIRLDSNRVTFNFEILDVADRVGSTRYPAILPAGQSLPFAVAMTPLDADTIQQEVQQQVRLITSFSLGLVAYFDRDYHAAVDHLGAAEEALEGLGGADKADSERASLVNYYLGRALQRVGRIEDGEQRLLEAAALHADDPAITLGLAYGRRAAGDLATATTSATLALEQASRWLSREPENVGVAYNRALALDFLGRHQEAGAVFDALTAARPDFYIAYLSAGQAHLAAGDQATAELRFAAAREQAIASGGDPTWATLMLGEAAMKRRALAEAESLFREAAALAPDLDWPHYQLGMLYQQAGKGEAALEAYTRLLGVTNEQAWAYGVRAAFFRSVRRYDEAIADYHKAWGLRQIDPWMPLYLAETYFEAGQVATALNLYDLFVSHDTPAQSYGLVSYGNALYRTGNVAAAAVQYERALALKPDDGRTRFNVALSKEALGDQLAARALYEQILSSAASPEDARVKAAERLAVLTAAQAASYLMPVGEAQAAALAQGQAQVLAQAPAVAGGVGGVPVVLPTPTPLVGVAVGAAPIVLPTPTPGGAFASPLPGVPTGSGPILSLPLPLEPIRPEPTVPPPAATPPPPPPTVTPYPQETVFGGDNNPSGTGPAPAAPTGGAQPPKATEQGGSQVIQPASPTTPTIPAAPTVIDTPTSELTAAPAGTPTEGPAPGEATEAPAVDPTQAPAVDPTQAPASEATEAPAVDPTQAPAGEATEAPASAPTDASAPPPTP